MGPARHHAAANSRLQKKRKESAEVLRTGFGDLGGNKLKVTASSAVSMGSKDVLDQRPDPRRGNAWVPGGD